MRIARFSYRKIIHWGIVEGKNIIVLKQEPFGRLIRTGKAIAKEKVKLLPPASPGKIAAVGLNYRDHAQELAMKVPLLPVIFLKPATSLIGHKQAIVYPKGVRRLDYEGELAVIIGRKGKDISKKDAFKYIFGYTCLNDVTARDLQAKDGQWTRAKSFDTFCPLGPWAETNINPSDLRIRTYLNGKVRQDSRTSNCIFDIAYIVSFISKIMTLQAGDVISTGTPKGVGPMRRGNTIEVEIEGIGRLSNRVI